MSRPTDPAAAKPAHPHVERELAEALGVAHDFLKSIRRDQLARGADWELVKGQVAYSDAGRAKALAALTADDSAPNVAPHGPDAGSEKNRAAAAEARGAAPVAELDAAALDAATEAAAIGAEIVTLVCAKLPRNRRIILARHSGALVRVRVKDSQNFRIGMELPARHVRDDLWQLEGKCPRYPGRF